MTFSANNIWLRRYRRAFIELPIGGAIAIPVAELHGRFGEPLDVHRLLRQHEFTLCFVFEIIPDDGNVAMYIVEKMKGS